MGQIIDTTDIGGKGNGKIWDADTIGDTSTPAPPPLAITQYTTSAGTTEAHTFDVVADGSIKTVWTGAKMQIITPSGITYPATWTSSDPEIASVNDTGVVLWHTAGSVTFVLTDAEGRHGGVAFTPTLFFMPVSVDVTWPAAESAAIAAGAVMPTLEQVTNSEYSGQSTPAERKTGSLWGEWGDVSQLGWPHATDGRMWVSDIPVDLPESRYYVAYYDGSARINGEPDITLEDGIGVIDISSN